MMEEAENSAFLSPHSSLLTSVKVGLVEVITLVKIYACSQS